MFVRVKKPNAVLTLEINGQFPLQDILCDLERATIGELLGIHGGIKARVAENLMLNRTTLVEKAKKYGFPLKK